MQQQKIAIFASGAGSNAQKIIDHFKFHPTISIGLIVCNKPDAGVTQIARDENIALLLINRPQLEEGHFCDQLLAHQIDFIVLAGFLLKIPASLIVAFPQRIINIHPALLPKFGGKGMYGSRVHEAVIAAAELESGITIHYVDEHYDHGATIFQTTCPISKTDTAADLAQKIHQLEHQFFASIIEKEVMKLASS